MYRKKSNPRREGNYGLMRFVSLNFPVTVGCMVTAGFLFMKCTPPPPPACHQCPEPLWKRYASFQSYQVKDEAARLEALLSRGDTASSDSVGAESGTAAQKLSALEVRKRLFELSIHHANPDYDLDNINRYLSLIRPRGGADSLRYLNWSRVLIDRKALLRERDSLQNVISEKNKNDSRSAENQKKEMRIFLKQRDSLTAVITTQQKMIMKLQNLDVLMEQQRNKIQ